MSSMKNLMIVALLAAAGYVVYKSLDRSNVEPASPPGVAEGWPAGPKVELPKTPSGGPLALGASPARTVTSPPLSSPLVAGPTTTPPAGTPGMTPATPYTSSTPSTGAGTILPTTLPASPTASLGAPMSPDTVTAMTMPNAVQTPSNSAVPPPGAGLADSVRNLNPPPAASNTAANPNDDLLQAKFAAFMDAVQKKLDEGKLADAHLALSSLYNNTNLPAEQAKQITDLLDRLAGTVIYSRQHHLEPAYMTQPGDTLESISQRYSIPWQLLARINGVLPANASNTDNTAKDKPLPPNTELKVIRGPFEAIVRLDKHELTLMLKNRYAGRFPIGVGRDQPKLDGSYTVLDKTPSPTYYGPDNVTINANDPKNPLGSAWIGLTDRIGIHGTNDPQSIGRDDNRGAISVGERDLQDLYGILSVGSRVTVTSVVR